MSQCSSNLIGSLCWVSWAVLVIVTFGVEPALAAGSHRSSDHRESQEKAARKACLTGDVSTGISILADMFIEYRDPVFVYNQGRCLEQNGRTKDAIVRFEEYLRLGDTMELPEGAREIAKKRINDCKARLVEVSPPQAVAPQPPPQPAPQPPVQNGDNPKPQAEPSSSGKGLLIMGIVAGSVGIGAVVAGYLSGRKSNDMVAEMQTNRDDYTSSKQSSQQTYKTLAWVGYGVGAACIVSGVVMITLGTRRRASPTPTEVALVPTIGPAQAGILVSGGF
jgi:hypothetical protein